MKKEYSKFIIILILALFLEVIVFTITSYSILFGNYEKESYKELEYLYTENEKAYLKIANINKKVGTVKIELKNIESPTEYQIFYSDETTNEHLGLNSKIYLNSSEKSKYIPVYLSGNTNSLIISIDEKIYQDGNIEEVVINSKIPFEFNGIRFIIILIVLLFGYLLKNGEIFNSEYSKTNLKQEFILISILFVFLLLTSCMNTYSDSQESIGESFIDRFSTNEGIYNKDFVESLVNKKLYLLDGPSEEFLKLENPYDNVTRDNTVKRDVDYKWDTAFYNGQAYIYFGILPLLLTFLPYYLITKKYLKISVVVFIFSMFIFILLKEILLKIIQKYFEKIPFKNVVLFLIILCSGTLIMYANGISRVYELVIIVGLYFVLQGIYFILKSSENEDKKYINIFLGSLCLALSVACRPTDLLISLLIVPYLLKLLIENIKKFKETKRDLFKLIFSVGVPYIIIGILLMWYNYIRFENPFEFGAKYQLTISNMYNLGSRIFAIPVGLMCNLFNIPNFIADFPFISNNNNISVFYGYYYIESMLGGLFMIAPICFFTFGIIKVNKKIENKELKTIINSLVIIGLIIAILSVMMAGSNQRYLIDYAWMFILAGILIYAVIYNSLKTEEAKKIIQHILLIIAIYTFIVGTLCGIISEKSYIQQTSPEQYYKLKYTICFWE